MKLISFLCDKIEIIARDAEIHLNSDVQQRCTAAMKLISFLCDKIEFYCERRRNAFEQRCTAAMYSSDL